MFFNYGLLRDDVKPNRAGRLPGRPIIIKVRTPKTMDNRDSHGLSILRRRNPTMWSKRLRLLRHRLESLCHLLLTFQGF
jgi:hypothetical protein